MAGFQKLVDVNFVLEGVTPLLQNNPDSMEDDATGVQSAAPKSIDPPDVAAAKRRYLADDGTSLVVPTSALYRCAVDGGSHMKVSKLTRLSTLLAAALYPVELWFPLLDADGAPRRAYAIDTRRVSLLAATGSSRKGGSVKRSRPRIDPPWFVRGHLMLDIALLPDAKILGKILDTAGAKLGIGDYRPQKKGWFGRFRVKQFVVGGEDLTAELS